MRAADREAMHGLAYPQRKPWALQHSEICPNDDERILAIVVDVDAADAATSWMDAEIARPNFVVTNPRNGHAHFVWLLDDEREGPIWVERQARAIRYADAIQRALTKAVGGDLRHTGAAWRTQPMHSPVSDRYVTREIHRHAYRLEELGVGLDLDAPRRAFHDAPGGEDSWELGSRNDGVFKWLLRNAGRVMQRCRDEHEYAMAMEQLASTANDACSPRLDPKEVATILKSAMRYRSFRRRDRAAECKAKRHAEGRSREAYLGAVTERRERARHLRAAGWTIPQISAELGVVTRTIDRYVVGVTASEKATISPILTQDDTGAGPSVAPIGQRQSSPVSDLAEHRNRKPMQFRAVQVGIEMLGKVVNRGDNRFERDAPPQSTRFRDEIRGLANEIIAARPETLPSLDEPTSRGRHDHALDDDPGPRR